MDELRITLLGFGSANRALARMLLSKSVPSPPTSKSSDKEGRRLCLRAVGGRSGSIGDDGSGVRLVTWRIVSIITHRHGRVCVPLRMHDTTTSNDAPHWEIDLEMALHRVESGGILDRSVVTKNQYPCGETNDDIQWHGIADQLTNADETLQLISQLGQSNTSNIVVEAIPSNTKGNGEPAISFIAMALQSKMHVISANKVPLAHTCCSDAKVGRGGVKETYWKLQQLATSNNVTYQHESAVMDGVPLFSLWKYTLPHASVTSIRGCLNSTTTMILSRMEGSTDDEDGRFDDVGGESFHDALIAAKEMGIVEEDDSLDLDGYDAAVKLRALLVVLSSTPLTSTFNETGTATVPTMDEISRDSIRNITPEDIGKAYSNGRKKYRLVASARLLDVPSSTNMEQDLGAENDGCRSCCPSKRWEASVKLQLLSPSDPLYNLRGTDSAIQFCTDVMGPVTVVSSNPTLVDTAYGLYSDIVRVACT